MIAINTMDKYRNCKVFAYLPFFTMKFTIDDNPGSGVVKL